ncbi:GWxTD domain-containing protein [candidate division GN15 bacterium]|nr:GWxTD domain-containing protein [candidate division GN15 bacterium]
MMVSAFVRVSNPARTAMRMRSVVAGMVVLIIVLSLPAVAQDDISIQAGLAVSNNPAYDSVALVDFPFTLTRSDFDTYQPDPTDSARYARVFAQVNLFNAAGQSIDSASTYFSVRASADTASGATLFNQLSLLTEAGVYTARLTVIDAVSKRRGSVFYDNVVVDPPARQLALGGERLAYRIRAVDPEAGGHNQRMVINGLEVLTNPVGLVDVADSLLWVYAELYNLAFAGADDTGSYRVRFRVLDRTGLPQHELGTIVRPKVSSSAVVAQSFEIAGWERGMYTLELAATDPQSGLADTCNLSFRILSGADVVEFVAARQSRNDPYDSLSLAEKINLVAYELTPDQKLTLESLSDQGKENYLRQYWKDHDANPATPVNETRLELMRRFDYTNELFSTNPEDDNGWLSDRGRIYMRYGEPEETVSRQAPEVGDPYLVWYYRTMKEGLVFVFEDTYGVGDFELVHSNADGELFNAIWDTRLKEGGYIEKFPDL